MLPDETEFTGLASPRDDNEATYPFVLIGYFLSQS